LEAQEVSVEEYKNLAKRIDTMEASVGFVLTKVEREFLVTSFF
jgi:tetrahydromethanopterin S-methyltransferase subunit G